MITPNPFTSGGARWNVMAAYGAWLEQGLKPKRARAKLLALFKNVSVQDKSARDALNTFLSGKGDVLLTYENEAIAAQLAKQPVQYVIPKATILIENPIAVLKDSANNDAANSFLRYLKTPVAQHDDRRRRLSIIKSVLESEPDRGAQEQREQGRGEQLPPIPEDAAAQQIFADYGYRPVVKGVLEANRKKFPKRPDLFTIDNLGLGGWDKVQKSFFDPTAGVMAAIERQVGGVTG